MIVGNCILELWSQAKFSTVNFEFAIKLLSNEASTLHV
jgi:hypothetical protein